MKNKDELKTETSEHTLTNEIVKKINDIKLQMKQHEDLTKSISEQLSAAAEKIGIKSAVLKRRINIIRKEEGSGGEIKQKNDDISFTEKYFLIQHGELPADKKANEKTDEN